MIIGKFFTLSLKLVLQLFHVNQHSTDVQELMRVLKDPMDPKGLVGSRNVVGAPTHYRDQ